MLFRQISREANNHSRVMREIALFTDINKSRKVPKALKKISNCYVINKRNAYLPLKVYKIFESNDTSLLFFDKHLAVLSERMKRSCASACILPDARAPRCSFVLFNPNKSSRNNSRLPKNARGQRTAPRIAGAPKATARRNSLHRKYVNN